ncbi:hypothetical protein JCM16303_004703 [Sporobolomyces ruberrimus]
MTSTQPRPSRPTTPLRRISSHSLRSLSLSHSQSLSSSLSPTSPSTALSHLSPLLTELSDSISDLCSNLENLGNVSRDLDRFNEGFSSYLYGLRINSYTFDFKHPPNKVNFELQRERRELEVQRERQDSERSLSPSRRGEEEDGRERDQEEYDRTATMGDSTFVTNDEHSFELEPKRNGTKTTRGGIARGRGTVGSGIARGRGRGTGRVGTTASAGGIGVMTKRKKEEISAFADPVFPLLPINLRENRRNECEKVLWTLKENPAGMGLGDLTKHLSNQTPPIPQVRINEVLLALVRAKVATKGLVKGVNLYRLELN